eukprot:jgi/Chlat1/7774/Chrsp66S07236
MKIEPGATAALVTGAGSGIGRALALELARQGCRVTVADVQEANGLETVRQIRDDGAGPSSAAHFVACDVTNPSDLERAFDAHAACFGRLDVCVNNAGVDEGRASLFEQGAHGPWRRSVEINLTAVIDGTRIAVREMRRMGRGGVVVNVASAAGIYPMQTVVQFTRALAWLAKKDRIRVCALCPQFIDTPMVRKQVESDPRGMEKVLRTVGGYVPMHEVVAGAMDIIADDTRAGVAMRITNTTGRDYWPPAGSTDFSGKDTLATKAATTSSSSTQHTHHIQLTPMSQEKLPSKYEKLIVHELSSDFRRATQLVTVSLHPPAGKNVLIKVLFAGVNASDVNYSAGRYFKNRSEALQRLPFDAGFEAVGVVAAVGPDVKGVAVGTPVACMAYGSFAEYMQVEAKHVMPVPAPAPEVVALLTSALTASLGLEHAGGMRPDNNNNNNNSTRETVLVTAAAGGTGQFAVQLAKLAGNTVVATCGSNEKARMLKELGVDRVVNYNKEELVKVLKAEFPNGVDLVYESVGGQMFTTCVNALATRGRLVIIGMMSQYTADGEKGWAVAQYPGLCEKLLAKSASVCGFFLLHYAGEFKQQLMKLYGLYAQGKLRVQLDPKQFVGVASAPDAVEYLHSGQSSGKVVVRMQAGMQKL